MSEATGTARVKRGMAEMLKGGVIMDVVNVEQAKIAEDAGACAVMALERVPADIRAQGGVARMSDPDMIEKIQAAVSIPVMAKVRIGHFVEAQIIESLGVDCEVVDVRSIQPFDSETAVASIKKTHRALVVHEAVRFGGFGGEIVAQLQEEAFDYLDAPIARVGAPFSPVPYSPALEKLYIPNAERIVAEVKKVLGI